MCVACLCLGLLCCHTLVLAFEVILVLPCYFSYRDSPDSEFGEKALAYFAFVCATVCVGAIFVSVRAWCGWVFAIRVAITVILAFYMAMQLTIVGFSIYVAYLYIVPWTEHGGMHAYFQNTYTGSITSYNAFASYVVFGAAASIALALLALSATVHAWHVAKVPQLLEERTLEKRAQERYAQERRGIKQNANLDEDEFAPLIAGSDNVYRNFKHDGRL